MRLIVGMLIAPSVVAREHRRISSFCFRLPKQIELQLIHLGQRILNEFVTLCGTKI